MFTVQKYSQYILQDIYSFSTINITVFVNPTSMFKYMNSIKSNSCADYPSHASPTPCFPTIYMFPK